MRGPYPEILDQLDRGAPCDMRPLGGGCIAEAAVVTFADGSKVFVKRASADLRMFHCEAEGLGALAKADALRVPEVLAVSENALVLEYIAQGRRTSDFFADFGRRFALLHRTRANVCGFSEDNFIGATPQRNRPVEGDWEEAKKGEGQDWPGFFIERRLRFQVELAADKGHGRELCRLLDSVENRIEELLGADVVPPSLLHGDLWGGNFMVDESGRACLIDPAVYFGHREADLAMTRLFGGFDQDFYAAYDEAWPLAPGHMERLPIYQLYHLLNHLNLFGSAYFARSLGILERIAK
jgi:protein-ribulosamine 3-kinase